MRTCLRVLLSSLVVLALVSCSGTAEPGVDDAAVAPRVAGIPTDADGVLQSIDPGAGTAVITDWEGVDHIVPDAGLEDATFVTYDGHVARPVVMTRGGTSAGKVAPLEGADGGSRELGAVKWVSATNGYGFITRQTGGDVFFDRSAILGGVTVTQGITVSFEVVEGPKGLRAVDIVLN